jgi:hypothetical protein
MVINISKFMKTKLTLNSIGRCCDCDFWILCAVGIFFTPTTLNVYRLNYLRFHLQAILPCRNGKIYRRFGACLSLFSTSTPKYYKLDIAHSINLIPMHDNFFKMGAMSHRFLQDHIQDC